MAIKTGLQLYTVRAVAQAEPVKTIEKMAACGYKGVQFAGYYDMDAKELRAALDRCGIKAAGSHVAFDLLDKDPQGQIAYALTLGLDNITIPHMTVEDLRNEEKIKRVAEIAKMTAEKGIALCYHNHAHEIQNKEGSKYLLEALYEKLPEVSVELDTYWATYGGADAFALIRQYAGRLCNIHIKDMKKDSVPGDANANIGEGCLDVAGYLKAAEAAGAKWAFVEMDRCDGDPLECAQISCKNLMTMGY